MIEVELKFEIAKDDISELIARLAELNFENGERLYEKTTMFDNPSKLMQSKNGRLRLRRIGKGKDVEYQFSYKKPINTSGIKKEIEYETNTKDGDDLKNILREMKFSETTSYERFRQTLTKLGLKVTIDEFPFSSFVEIEGKEREIKSLAKSLGFSLIRNLVEPCDTLFARWRDKRGLSDTPHMTFKDFDK